MRTILNILVIAASAAAMQAEVVDSVVAVVDGQPIKHSDVIREIRLTAFMNQEEIDRSPAEQKKALSRVIDQVLIRQELAVISNMSLDEERAGALLQQLRESYGNQGNFRQRLASYEISEADLLKQLTWQVTVLQFIEFRFGRSDLQGETNGASINDEFFAWLDSMREQKRIDIREERLT